MSADILIAGVGHHLMGNASLGRALMHQLKQVGLPSCARLYYAGSTPIDFLGELAGSRKLIVVDVLTGGEPGTIIKKNFLQQSDCVARDKVESHEIGLVQTLCLARELVPDCDILNVGADIVPHAAPGLPLTDSLRECIPVLI